MLQLTDDNFKSEVEDHAGVALVDFWATWCGPCRMLTPKLEQLASEIGGRVKFAKADVDECQDLAARFDVRSIPCLILFKAGKEVDRLIGAQYSPAQLKAWIDDKAK